MSDFYSALSKEALAEDDYESDVSADGDLNNILADMDDLDANLFGTPAVKGFSSSVGTKPGATASTPAIPIRTSTTPSTPASMKPSDKPANKSRLLAELFGETDSTIVFSSATTDVAPTATIQSSPEHKIEPHYAYTPTSESRQRRRQPPTNSASSADDLWSKFLQPEIKNDTSKLTDITKNSNVEDVSNKIQTEKKIDPISLVTKSPQKNISSFDIHFSPNKQSSLQFQNPDPKSSITSFHSEVSPQVTSASLPTEIKNTVLPVLSAEQQMELLKPHIESLIQEYVKNIEISNQSSTLESEELKSKIDDMLSSQQKLEEYIDDLKEQITSLQETLEEQQESAIAETREWQQKLVILETEHKNVFLETKEQNRQQVAKFELKVLQLQQQLEEMQQVQIQVQSNMEKTKRDNTSFVKDQLSSGIDILKAELNEELQSTTVKVRSLENQLNRLTLQLEEKHSNEDTRLSNVEAKCRQLSSKNSARWEEDLEFRVEQTENNLDTRLTNTNRQHARLAAWHEKQIADLTEYIDQRLWSLYNQLEIQRRELVSMGHRFVEQQATMLEPCVESQVIKKLINERETSVKQWQEKQDNKILELERNIGNAQNETCKLSRLADRLCTILQMWEQKNKTASRLQADNLQSLNERYNMAIIEMEFNKRK